MEGQPAVITHNVVSLRAAPNSSSEQVSQAILGDNITLFAELEGYARIRTLDAYEGWALRRHLRPYSTTVSEPVWPFGFRRNFPQNAYRVLLPFAELLERPGDRRTLRTKLVFGTWVIRRQTLRTAEERFYRVLLPGDGASGYARGYIAPEALINASEIPVFGGEAACTLARQFLGTPYLWGGTTPFGFDCSGFVQRIYGMLGVNLPRDAYQQAESPLGTALPPGATLQAGDLVFFRGPGDPLGRGITHVGIALDQTRFIHASGAEGVVITTFDDPVFTWSYTCVRVWRV